MRCVSERDLSLYLIALLAPAEQAALRNRVSLANRGNHGAVRQLGDRSRYGMDPFAAAVQPLLVQYGIHLRRQRRLPCLCLAPGGAKCLGISAAAEEARAVTCGKGHRFVEKEKLGPAAAAHYLPVPPHVVENTNEPRLGRPAPPEQRFGCRVVDDPAVADEKASLRDRNDIAKRGHPVL
jgi:hypothetical protein